MLDEYTCPMCGGSGPRPSGRPPNPNAGYPPTIIPALMNSLVVREARASIALDGETRSECDCGGDAECHVCGGSGVR